VDKRNSGCPQCFRRGWWEPKLIFGDPENEASYRNRRLSLCGDPSAIESHAMLARDIADHEFLARLIWSLSGSWLAPPR
jgi:hypothetical protein